MIFLLIWAGAFLALGLYTRIAQIGTGQYIIIGALILIFLGLLGIVLSLYEEVGRAGKDPWPIGQPVERNRQRLSGSKRTLRRLF